MRVTIFVHLILLQSMFLVANTPAQSASQWIHNPSTGHWYVILQPQSWTSAQNAAQCLGGYLAVIGDSAESSWLYSNFGGASFEVQGHGPWIGLFQDVTDPTYAEPSGAWKWINGEPLGWTDWDFGEPNDLGPEQFGHFHGSCCGASKWNDLEDTGFLNGLFGIVERETQPLGSAYALETSRLGIPQNPDVLLPGLTSGPVIGSIWDPIVDHTTFFPSASIDVLVITSQPTNSITPIGTLLCDLLPPVLLCVTTPNTPFSFRVPNVCSVVGASYYSQAASTDGVTVALTNALDLVIGAF